MAVSTSNPAREVNIVNLIVGAAIVISTSFILCWAAIELLRTGWLALVRPGDLDAVQAAHSAPTPRIGGVAILAAFLIGCGLTFFNDGSLWWLLALSVAPLFLSGIAEDLGYRVSPVGRLGAALLSSAIAVVLTGSWIGEIGITLLDSVFAWTPFAVLITILAASTISHAFNLIDGLNGLSGFTAVFASSGIAATAFAVGDTEIAVMGVLLVAATTGFLLLNFPSGKIFLGDAGAYTLGFLLAWLGITLAARSPDVTPIAMVLILFWPLADVSLAIYRRYRRNLPVSHPDRLHFHQLVMRGLEICVLGRGRRQAANPLATLVLLPLIAVPMVLGVLLHGQPLGATLALAVCFAVFFATYGLGMRLATKRADWMRTSKKLSKRGTKTLRNTDIGSRA